MTIAPRKTERSNSVAKPLIAAWQHLYPDPESGRPGDAGARAALRRAGSPSAVLMEPAFHAVLRRMTDSGFGFDGYSDRPAGYLRLALLASLLAERRNDGSGVGKPHFMAVLGSRLHDEKPRLSPLRFQALMAALERRDGEETMTAMRRAMRMVADVEFNLFAFADDVMNWNDKVRIRWTFDYFGRPHVAVPAASSTTNSNSEES